MKNLIYRLIRRVVTAAFQVHVSTVKAQNNVRQSALDDYGERIAEIERIIKRSKIYVKNEVGELYFDAHAMNDVVSNHGADIAILFTKLNKHIRQGHAKKGKGKR